VGNRSELQRGGVKFFLDVILVVIDREGVKLRVMTRLKKNPRLGKRDSKCGGTVDDELIYEVMLRRYDNSDP
jgi:hypothetical protein